MCATCVAQAMPYVGLAVGGLRAMSWSAGRNRPTAETVLGDARSEDAEEESLVGSTPA